MIEQDDIEDAEPAYSQYAVKSILVENGVTLPELGVTEACRYRDPLFTFRSPRLLRAPGHLIP
jgi:hypothetical protein